MQCSQKQVLPRENLNTLFLKVAGILGDKIKIVSFIESQDDESVKRDLKDWNISKEIALDRSTWRLAINVSEP